ncbi:MAG: ABA4-like family protein [Rubrivivax sp.]
MPTAVLHLPLDALFSAVSTAAMVGWVLLIVGPRLAVLRRVIAVGIVGSLCLVYGVLAMAFFFTVPGGGFGTLDAVMRLFTVREVALAGWVHYLAFDLAMGLWIAQRADAEGVSRWLQAPVLVVTFMFGPLGLLMGAAVLAVRRRRAGVA